MSDQVSPASMARDMLRTLLILFLCTLTGYLFRAAGLTNVNIIMIFILGVLGVSLGTTGRSYSLLASALAVLIFNYCFTQPLYSFVSDPSYYTTFIVMFVVAILGSTFTVRVKHQAARNAGEAYRTEVLLETSQRLQQAEGEEAIFDVIAAQLGKLLGLDLIVYPVDDEGHLGKPLCFQVDEDSDIAACCVPAERTVAKWVLLHRKQAGPTTTNYPHARCFYTTMESSGRVLAVVGLAVDAEHMPDPFERNLAAALLDECGLALEKERMLHAKQAAEEAARQEALRSNLLRAISHDLRTPLTSISGTAGILMERGETLSEDKKHTLYTSIYDDSMWLIDLVENLLSITQMENGSMKLNMEPELVEEVFSEALAHLDRNADRHVISVHLEDDLLMANMDARLIVQVVINLLNNAIKYTPVGSHIDLSATRTGSFVTITVADDGPGVDDQCKKQLFEMFYTANNVRGDGRRGMGLGLALCRSIVTAHGGTIQVFDNRPSGAVFTFTLYASEVDIHE